MLKYFVAILLGLLPAALSAEEAGWVSLFNGKDLTGWRSNEEVPGVFSIVDGAIQVKGGRAHLFYVGEDGKADFRDFELKMKVKTLPGANSGLYFHTGFQEKGWPDLGYECQVNASHKDPKKTGSLYGVVNWVVQEAGKPEPKFAVKNHMAAAAPHQDEEWFDYLIQVKGKKITLTVNGVVTAEFEEPVGWDPAVTLKNMPGRKLGSAGQLAIQGHDPLSTAYFKEMFIRPL
jgi:Domain of Unknown Function (DUF1080)